ncbi:MAG: hypothetical protein REI78_01790 [Pedobacter sp.]|nr:hypothetical protein [Pedobacter sp.]MDQ8051722.1 hypothetical protein [Pedobacter sp.]
MENQHETDKGEIKGPTAENESKPVGYGSSIQSDGHGNRTRPQNQEDVNPTTQQDHIQSLKDSDQQNEPLPKTDGTGSNRPVDNGDSLIVKEDPQSN